MRKGILIDLSGTLHIGNQQTPYAVDALKKLKASGKFKIKFVSNTTKDSRQNLLKQLQEIGFPILSEEIMTSLSATKDYLIQQGIQNPQLVLTDSAKEEFQSFSLSKTNQDAVVIGLAPDLFNYLNLNKAFHILQNPNIPLIAMHKSKYFASTNQQIDLGPGAFISGLEYSIGRQAVLIGKPNPSFFQLALKDLNLEANECYMIGDDVNDDINGSQELGIAGILVKTGKYKDGDENGSIKPCKTFENFSQAVDFLLSNA